MSNKLGFRLQTNIEKLAAFAADTDYASLPAVVVEESKRVILDSLGCALGGLSHPKGSIGVEFAKLQGPGLEGLQASVLGTRATLSGMGAAFANAELINALDFDSILPPGHVSPYVIPGALAAAEMLEADGKSFLTSIAIAHEMSNRMGKGLDYLRDIKDGKISPPPVHGYASTIFGATAAVGRVKGYTSRRIADAMAIAASMAPMNAQWSWSLHAPTATIKYAVAGALVQAAMTGASLAELGHTGDRKLLDDAEAGWPRMSGSLRWAPESVLAGLGTEWGFPREQVYKPYPHCRAQHAPIQVVSDLVRENNIKPSEIESIKAWVEGFVMQPLWLERNIEHVTQGQFVIAHGLAVAAHLLPPDKKWQSEDVVFSPSVLALMGRIKCEVHPDYERMLMENASSRPTRIEIKARGQTFIGERRWAKGTPSPDPETYMTTPELVEKFMRNADGVLTERQAKVAAEMILDVESVKSIAQLMAQFRPAD